MIQIIGLLAISWGLLHFFERKNLTVLGLKPNATQLTQFLVFFVVSAAISASAFFLRMYIAQEHYAVDSTLNFQTVVVETWHQFRSVLTEELLFRGALLYILIRRLGQSKAILLTSVLFALMHWTNPGVWGNVIQMALLFGFTFVMGLLLSYAYAKTYSLLVPLAIHFGWNLVQNYVFSETATNPHVYALAEPAPVVTISYLAFFTMLLLPKVLVLGLNYWGVRQIKQAEMP